MSDFGKVVLTLGVILVVIGALMIFAARIGLPLGRMPGDLAWRGKSVRIYFPLGTCILLSILLTVVFWLISHLRK